MQLKSITLIFFGNVNRYIYDLLRAADRYAYTGCGSTGCGSTACSVGTVYGGKRDLYTPDARRVRPVGGALLAGPGRPCLPNSNRNAACSQHDLGIPIIHGPGIVHPGRHESHLYLCFISSWALDDWV